MTKYLLKIKDLSGRDYSNVLPFKTELGRKKAVTEFLMTDGATKYELAEMVRSLEIGNPVEIDATEYEFLIQYAEEDRD